MCLSPVVPDFYLLTWIDASFSSSSSSGMRIWNAYLESGIGRMESVGKLNVGQVGMKGRRRTVINEFFRCK